MNTLSISMSFDLTGIPVAVLMGGPGSERKVSLKSGEGVVDALRSLGALVTPVDVTGADFAVPVGTRVAFNVVHGTFGEDGQIQRILEARGIPYTGEGVRGSELAMDKIASKRRFVERGVPTAKSEIIRNGT
ncbi:MAG: D-alanine--D-alanine ligase, partial [Chthoniobacteraceae bacterium]